MKDQSMVARRDNGTEMKEFLTILSKQEKRGTPSQMAEEGKDRSKGVLH